MVYCVLLQTSDIYIVSYFVDRALYNFFVLIICVCASEQRLNLMSYTNNLNTYIWSYIQWIYKTNLYENITCVIPSNIRYLIWNTQYIAYVRRHTICTLQVNTYDH